jgi:transposase
VVQYNASLVALLNHYGAVPHACRPYRAKTTYEIEYPLSLRRWYLLAAGDRVAKGGV